MTDLLKSNFKIQGQDMDGKISQVDPGKFSDVDAAVMGYEENLP